ncbi:uncharacterized protein [Solanum tuberosum]|uniref:uncharacterized protein n=1 Tax=Solanum tuberosum TaxID=4113 RepID=UPI00073A2D61|nr:PREDICTED: uncharacterized protein LOC107062821 [Solanum tuberosum]
MGGPTGQGSCGTNAQGEKGDGGVGWRGAAAAFVPIKLTGPENYALWSRSMKLALRGKGKLGFIDESCRKTAFKGALEEQWEKCNAIVLSRIASTVTSELLLRIIYASNAKKVWEDFEERDLWSELDVMIPSPGCNCEDSTAYVGHLRSQRLLQFLMGLNESFSSIRSNILAKKPVITVNEAYAVAAQEESQRALGVSERTRDPLTLLAKSSGIHSEAKEVRYSPGFQSKRKGTDGYKNDYKAAEGFRPDFKPNAHFTRNVDDFNGRGKQAEGAHFTRNADDFYDRGKQAEGHMTPPQYQDLVNKMDRAGTSDCVANMSGMASLNSKPSRVYEWIIDSGATHHITPNEELMTAIRRIQGNNSDGGLYDGKVLRIDKEREGLYILKKQIKSPVQAMATANLSGDATLWHLRLGHASTGILQHIQSLKHLSNKNIQHECEICPLAKQYRLQFPFGLSVKTLRSDNGTKFFNSFVNDLLASQGIIHQSSCAYIPQQNGKVERKHRHILEMARALRFQSCLPIHLWGECVRTAVYLINKIPTEVLGGRSPYEMLLKKVPRLDHLRIFGCLCYAAQLPRGDKFAPRARKTIFLGYSETQKGYGLFDLVDNVFFVSRDVTFRESTFPYQTEPAEPTSTDLNMFELQNSDYLSPRLINSSDHPTEYNTTPIPDLILETSPASIPEDIPTTDVLPSLQPTEKFLPITDQSKSRPSRTIKPPRWLNNFITTSKAKPPSASCSYPISDSFQYSHLSPLYQAYLGSFSPQVEPKTFREASQDSKWIAAMTDELCALDSNHTWEVVDLPPGKQAIGSKWVFKIKHKANGTVDKYKARLVAKGYTQKEGLDYHETFSLVAKMITVRTIISVAASKDWLLIQMDVNNAFLQGDLHEEVYMSLPQGFHRQGETRVCKLLKSLYGLKQTSRQWNIKLSTALLETGYIQSSHDYSLFTKQYGNDIVVILVYVDDLMIIGNNQQLIDDAQRHCIASSK